MILCLIKLRIKQMIRIYLLCFYKYQLGRGQDESGQVNGPKDRTDWPALQYPQKELDLWPHHVAADSTPHLFPSVISCALEDPPPFHGKF